MFRSPHRQEACPSGGMPGMLDEKNRGKGTWVGDKEFEDRNRTMKNLQPLVIEVFSVQCRLGQIGGLVSPGIGTDIAIQPVWYHRRWLRFGQLGHYQGTSFLRNTTCRKVHVSSAEQLRLLESTATIYCLGTCGCSEQPLFAQQGTSGDRPLYAPLTRCIEHELIFLKSPKTLLLSDLGRYLLQSSLRL